MARKKVAITIRKDLLDAAESKIDGTRIRNRSQAIEHLIMKAIKTPSVSQAVILEHGYEHHAIEKDPIPLMEVGGKTILERNLDFMEKYGIASFFLFSEREHLNDFREFLKKNGRKNVTLVPYDRRHGTVGRLKVIESRLGENFIVINGDCIADFDLGGMIKTHLYLNSMATIGLLEDENYMGRNLIRLEGNRIIEYSYLPVSTVTHITSSGFYVLNKTIFKSVRSSTHTFEHDLFPQLAAKKQLNGYVFSGAWHHFFSEESVAAFDKDRDTNPHS